MPMVDALDRLRRKRPDIACRAPAKVTSATWRERSLLLPVSSGTKGVMSIGSKWAVRISLAIAGACTGAVLSFIVASPPAEAAGAIAKNLPLTGAVRAQLVAAGAAYHGLPASDFIGLAPGTAYYALDVTTSTYWAGASLEPNPRSYEAGVVVQDDGGYLIFHRPANGTWRAVQDGMLTTAAACARYHVTLPAAVLAVWHWGPGTCTPPLPPAPKQSELALAKLQWQFGAQAGPTANANEYGPGGTVVPFWVSAAKDLTKAVTAGVADPVAYRRAVAELSQLAHLPFVVNTPLQDQAVAVADLLALNAFFSTDGLYDVNAPSATPAAFVATLQFEARIGTIQVYPDGVLNSHPGAIPPWFPGAVVTCPVLSAKALADPDLSALDADAAFGCRMAVPSEGTYYLIGTISEPHATVYQADITHAEGGPPQFLCSALEAGQVPIVTKIGAICSP